jgi:hypothetical protein
MSTNGRKKPKPLFKTVIVSMDPETDVINFKIFSPKNIDPRPLKKLYSRHFSRFMVGKNADSSPIKVIFKNPSHAAS